jgi:hypothetical protein
MRHCDGAQQADDRMTEAAEAHGGFLHGDVLTSQAINQNSAGMASPSRPSSPGCAKIVSETRLLRLMVRLPLPR